MNDHVEAGFRKESSRMLASLVRAFGPGHLTLAEDVVQETFHRALILWPAHGTPPNPSAWLHRVARNLALDAIRREKIYSDESTLEGLEAKEVGVEMFDDELRLLFLCCHPLLSVESQIALTLKSLCGLGVGEIAKALLTTEANVAQRIVRAKRALVGASFELPSEAHLESRLDTVLKTLYLLFNEGYSRRSGPELTDGELCDEAITLTSRLVRTTVGNESRTHALLALMFFHSSRLPARIDASGSLCLLEEQDRFLWDRSRIRAGLRHLELSANGTEISTFHPEAAIAAYHAMAPSFEESNWIGILEEYEQLEVIGGGVIAKLNGTVALSMVAGPEAAIEALDEIADHPKLRDYYLLPATRARFLERLGKIADARDEYERAHTLARNEAERKFLAGRIAVLERAIISNS